MNRKGLFLALTGAVVVTGVSFLLPKAQNRDLSVVAEVAAKTSPLPGHASLLVPERSIQRSTMALATSVSHETLCRGRSECADDPLIANSEAELYWMRRHGFPTKQEAQRLQRLSEADLQVEARHGNLTAMTALGERMIDRGDSNGMSWFLRAKNRGSLYAYYMQSKAEMNPSMGHGFVESGAFLRVAHLLGDSKAEREVHRFIEKNRLSHIELYAIDRRASELYASYAKNRQPSPRPRD